MNLKVLILSTVLHTVIFIVAVLVSIYAANLIPAAYHEFFMIFYMAIILTRLVIDALKAVAEL